MSLYALAVDRVAARLSEAERVILRDSRQVPDWFLPAVLAQFRGRDPG